MKILVCDYCPDFFLEKLEEKDFQITYLPEIENENIFELKNEFEAILIKSSLILNEQFFTYFNLISLILRPGSGLDNVDKNYCKNHGIRVINSPEGNSNAVGEFALGLLLNLVRYIPKAFSEVKEGSWIREENRGIELENKYIGVIGVGNAGTAFCKKIRGFDVQLLPHDIYKPFIHTIEKESVSLQEIFQKAEIVSLHLPLNTETKYYANEAFFNSFSKPIYFLNTSRGPITDTKALLQAIEQGKVRAAALDVIEKEPLEKNSSEQRALLQKLINTGKVHITPHIAGWTHEAKNKMFSILLDKYFLSE